MARRHSFIAAFAIGSIATALVGACSATKAANTFTGGDTGGGDSSANSGNGAGNSSGFGNGGNLITDGGPPADAMGCAWKTSKAEELPLDLFIMLDQSASMNDMVAGNVTKWAAVTGAITAFVQQPAADGIGVGIQYFGLPPSGPAQCSTTCTVDADCGAFGPCLFGLCVECGGDSCAAADYAVADVEIAPLPGVGPLIINSLGMHMPNTNTPTSAALEGAIQHAEAWEAAHPTHKTLVILATDGDPTECDTTLADIDAIAGTGYGHMPRISTFVIGVGTSLTALNGIAFSGGTNQAFVVDTNQDVNQQFLTAMNTIRGASLACDYLLPTPEAGVIDPDKVNVQYTPGSGGSPEILPEVADYAMCPTNGDAWYYDDPAAPSQIEMCDFTCKKLSQDSKGEVDILLGCKSVLK